MPALASLSVLSLRWRPPRLWMDDDLTALADIMSKEMLDGRLGELQRLVRTKCPSNHIDYYIFIFAIGCIVCSAAFSLVARSADISMWYPLILLLIPAGLSFYTSRRRSKMTQRIKQFEHDLKQLLREFTKDDGQQRGLRWTFRRPTSDDPIPTHYTAARLCLLIEIRQVDPEAGLPFDDDTPPSYQQAALDSPADCPPPSYNDALTTTTPRPPPSLPLPERPEPARCHPPSFPSSLLPNLPSPTRQGF